MIDCVRPTPISKKVDSMYLKYRNKVNSLALCGHTKGHIIVFMEQVLGGRWRLGKGNIIQVERP